MDACLPSPPVAAARERRPKPWWRRWDGMPGDLAPDQFVTPAVARPGQGAEVLITREHRYADSRRAYNVWVDDEPVGRVEDSDHFQVTLNPGPHRVRLTLGSSWSSPEVVISLDPGGTARLRCCNNFGWAPVVSLVLGLFLPFRWIRLWEEDADWG